jgi:hypothetical protein
MKANNDWPEVQSLERRSDKTTNQKNKTKLFGFVTFISIKHGCDKQVRTVIDKRYWHVNQLSAQQGIFSFEMGNIRPKEKKTLAPASPGYLVWISSWT